MYQIKLEDDGYGGKFIHCDVAYYTRETKAALQQELNGILQDTNPLFALHRHSDHSDPSKHLKFLKIFGFKKLSDVKLQDGEDAILFVHGDYYANNENPYKARHYQVGGEVNPYQRAPLESLVGITPSARPEYRAIHEGGQAPIDTQYVGDLERRGAITRPAADIVRNVITDPGSDGGFGDGGTNPSGASFASPTEALAWNQAGLEHGYYGTVDDAADAARGGNQAAINTLQSFIATGPTGIVETPGLIGLGIDAITDVREDRTNINTALGALSDTGDLYSDPGGTNSSGYFGDDVQTQQTVSDVDATSTYGDWSGWSDDNNDSDNNDGGWGGQAAADDDYGTVDDFGGAGPDVGGDSGGGGGDGSYCCTASVKQKVMSNKELYALHKWHHSQDSWWVNGYDVWGKWVAKNLVSKHKYFAHLTKAFYNWKVNGKFTAKAAQAAVIIYPGVVIASLLKKQSPQKLAQS